MPTRTLLPLVAALILGAVMAGCSETGSADGKLAERTGGDPDAAAPPASPKAFDLLGAEVRLRAAVEAAGVAWPLADLRIRIYKERRLLELVSGTTVVRSYRVGLGNEPHLDKVRQGDHRTPEGDFYVCTRNDRSRFHLFLGVSYPMARDAERGLRDRLVSRAQYNAILRAEARRERPPWDTGLGGEVGIHGGGSSSDWTWGCIALENPEIEELWVVCKLRTPVTIFK